MYHVGFIDDVLRILRCVCFNCSRLLLDKARAQRKHGHSESILCFAFLPSTSTIDRQKSRRTNTSNNLPITQSRPQNDEQVKRIVATRRRGARLKALHDLCKGSTKRMCLGSKPPEGADPILGAEMAGCGTMQVGASFAGLLLNWLGSRLDFIETKKKIADLTSLLTSLTNQPTNPPIPADVPPGRAARDGHLPRGGRGRSAGPRPQAGMWVVYVGGWVGGWVKVLFVCRDGWMGCGWGGGRGRAKSRDSMTPI